MLFVLALLKDHCAPAVGYGSEVTAALGDVDVTVVGSVCVLLTAEKAGGHNSCQRVVILPNLTRLGWGLSWWAKRYHT